MLYVVEELTATEQATLDVRWDLRPSAPLKVRRVQDAMVERGGSHTTADVERALDRLVETGHARRLCIPRGQNGAVRTEYMPARRYGEKPPAICERSEFAMCLWEARADWRLWRLGVGERMVWVDNWGKRASADE